MKQGSKGKPSDVLYGDVVGGPRPVDEKKRRRGAISHIEMPWWWSSHDLFSVSALALLEKGHSSLLWKEQMDVDS